MIRTRVLVIMDDTEMKVIAFITEHDVIDAIRRHLERKEAREARGPPN